ncbi:hypothetical protein D9611_001129 [Ephemerocybe angulata]|uniref:Beta-xylanase n=1 Tax=Ephemerocybe angulata TaxID=980116 RepID=A0A8H5CKB4_9AGAR|nr:hypothetical protein D9611_001129 [Tulosesus angulatus]
MKVSLILAIVSLLSAFSANASLDSSIKAKGKLYFGNIIDGNTINDASVTNLLKSEFGAVTAEYSWKWPRIQPTRGVFNFQESDLVLNWAVANKKLIRGHTFVWHQNIPEWVNAITDKATLTAVIQDHITKVAGRYKGKVYAWDVVNEVFEDNGSFRNSVFYRVLQEDFIDIAFRAARAADPAAKLYINEYGLDAAGPKIDAFLALVGRLKSRGVPIDGLGTQSHLILGMVAGVPAQLQRLANTGLDVAITELDIRIPKPVNDAKLAQQQLEYQSVIEGCLSVSKCVGISMWGVSDRNSWIDTTIPAFSAPLLWDNTFRRKLAFTGVDAIVAN